jgi:hypothetical protein
MSMSADPQALAVDYITAVGNKQFDRVAELFHPDIEFATRGKTLRGADACLVALRRLGPILLRNDVQRTVLDGNEVCVVYDFVTDTLVGAVPSVEWITFDAGRIRSVRLLFETANWPIVLAELTRRAAAAQPGGASE